MTRPTAPPVLTADYYTYSTYSQRDCYGGFEPKAESDCHGPVRMEPVICKNKSRCQSKDTTPAKIISFFYLVGSFVSLLVLVYFYSQGIRNQVIIPLGGLMCLQILISVMMLLGIANSQPFLCIPFVVFRTMEAFTIGLLIGVFVYVLVNRNGETYKVVNEVIRQVGEQLPTNNVNLNDAAFQLCLIAIVALMVVLSYSVSVCRISFHCTMKVADELRARRMNKSFDQSRVRITSDELYCS